MHSELFLGVEHVLIVRFPRSFHQDGVAFHSQRHAPQIFRIQSKDIFHECSARFAHSGE